MPSNPVYERLEALSENELRRNIIVPLLAQTEGVHQVTDVHGTDERGLDVVFCTKDAIRTTWYGLQLKKGNISGGGRGNQTVKQIVDQLELARISPHSVASPPAGDYRIERFIVATSGRISQTARSEIARRLEPMSVEFWDLSEIVKRAKGSFADLLKLADAEMVTYLSALRDECEFLDALDQVPGVAERRLSDVFVEIGLKRRIDPSLTGDRESYPGSATPALFLRHEEKSTVVIGEQNEGKTAILRMIAIRSCEDLLDGGDQEGNTKIPVLLRASDILTSTSVPRAVAKALEKKGATTRAARIDEDCSLSDYIILVDSFSELPAEEAKNACAELILHSEEHQAGHFIVAARPDDFLRPQYFSSAHHYSIPPLNQEEIRSLVRRWTKDAVTVQDVAEKLIDRVRDALQLPGSPIPAIIGVMLYEKEQRFITNTADAVDRYMQIRLGRYAREMGVPMEVNWARKQDLLGELAYEMVRGGNESVEYDMAVNLLDKIYSRLGEEEKSRVAIQELIDAGVLLESEGHLRFYRTAFRDFFAAHHLNRKAQEFDDFFERNFFARRWGQVLVFAAGLRRHNSDLLLRLNDIVEKERNQLSVASSEDYLYGAYLLGRILSNSDYSDNDPRVAVLTTTIAAANESARLLGLEAKEQFGNIGEVISLIGTEHTLFVAVGVPWLQKQIMALAADPDLPEEERYLFTSLHTSLAGKDWIKVFHEMVTVAKSPRVIAALLITANILESSRQFSDTEKKLWKGVRTSLARKHRQFKAPIARALKLKSKILELEQQRMRRLAAQN